MQKLPKSVIIFIITALSLISIYYFNVLKGRAAAISDIRPCRGNTVTPEYDDVDMSDDMKYRMECSSYTPSEIIAAGNDSYGKTMSIVGKLTAAGLSDFNDYLVIYEINTVGLADEPAIYSVMMDISYTPNFKVGDMIIAYGEILSYDSKIPKIFLSGKILEPYKE